MKVRVRDADTTTEADTEHHSIIGFQDGKGSCTKERGQLLEAGMGEEMTSSESPPKAPALPTS